MGKQLYDYRAVSIFPKLFKMELPDGYRIDTEYDDDFNEVYHLRGGFYINDNGIEDFEFTAYFINLNIEITGKKEGYEVSPGEIFNMIANGVMENLQEEIGTGTRFNLFNSFPCSTIFKFYKPFSLFGTIVSTYAIFCLVEVDDNTVFGFNTVYQEKESGNGEFYKHLLNVIKSISVDGKSVDIGKLTPKKLEQALEMEKDEDIEAFDPGLSIGISIQNGDEETNYTINSDGNITSSDGDEFSPYDSDEETEVSLFDLLGALRNNDEVAFSDEDSRKVVVDNNWSFRLPTGTDLRFDAEHLDIMGNYSEAQYVVLGLNHNGRDFFDFELHERFDYGMSTDLDVSGCRYDDDVISGDAQQHIILNGDDLYVDVVNKPIFFARSMVMIRVRGENLNPWDFVMGIDGWDDDQNAVWNEVKSLIFDMAGSIKLIDPSEKSIKKSIDNIDNVYKDEESEWEWKSEATDNWMEKYSEHVEYNPTIVFEGKKFVTSGIYGDEEKNIKQKISEFGGINRTQVSGVTDYLIVKPYSAGESKICSAIEQAEKGKGIKIILLEDLEKAIEDNVYSREVSEPLNVDGLEDLTVDMYVTLINEKKLGKTGRSQEDFYEVYNEDFPNLSKGKLIRLYSDVHEMMRDPKKCEYYDSVFRKRSLKERFDLSTRNYFNCSTSEYAQRIEEAIENTSEWYSREEFKEVRHLLDLHLDEQRKKLDEQIDSVDESWKQFTNAKQYLRVSIKSNNAEDAKLNEHSSFFQKEIDDSIVEVILSTQGIIMLQFTLLNSFTWYWNKGINEIWREALKNEIKDERIFDDDSDEIARKAYNRIMQNYPEKEKVLSDKAKSFVQVLKELYDNPYENDDPASIVNSCINRTFNSKKEFGECRRFLLVIDDVTVIQPLLTMLDDGLPASIIYDEIAEAIAEDIAAVKEKAKAEHDEKNYKEAVELLNSGSIADLKKAVAIFGELRGYKDSEEQKSRLEIIISQKQKELYNNALLCFEKGTEDSVKEALDIMLDLGQYKDAPDKAKEYGDKYEYCQKITKAKTLSQSDKVADIEEAVGFISEYTESSSEAEQLYRQCNGKIEQIKSDTYAKAVGHAESRTEESLLSAISLMKTIAPYKDAEQKIDEFAEELNKESAYIKACSMMGSERIDELTSARETLKNLDDYKDSETLCIAFDKIIKQLTEKTYQEAGDLEKELSIESQKDAIEKYSELGKYKDSTERKDNCSNNIKLLYEIDSINKTIEDQKKELIDSKNKIKKKERQTKELLIKEKEQQAAELKEKVMGLTAGSYFPEQDSIKLSIGGAKDNDEKPEVNANPEKSSKKVFIIIAISVIIILIAALIIGSSSNSEPTTNNSDSDNEVEVMESEGFDNITSGKLREDLLKLFEKNYTAVTDETESQFDDSGSIAFTVDGEAVIICTQNNEQDYDYDSPLDYCAICTNNEKVTAEYSALVVSYLFNDHEYEEIKNDIQEKIEKSKEEIDESDDINFEGLEYSDYSLYCAYNEKLNIVIPTPPDIDINDILEWFGFENLVM